MATPNEILAKRIDRFTSIPNKFLKAVNSSQPELYAELLTFLSDLQISGGNFVLSADNLLAIDEIMNQYYLSLRNGKYGGQVSWLLNEMGKQKSLIDEFTEISYNAVASARTQTVFTSATQQAARSLLGDDFKTNFINVIRDQVISAVEQQSNFREFSKAIQSLFVNEERDGQILNWCKQVANDRFAAADRAYSNAIGVELGLQFIRYAGGLIEDSREFCVDRHEKYYHVEEVREWGNIEQWQGRYRRTTPDNIIDWLGGYNCKHVATYVSEAVVPADVIQRAKDKGFYK